MRFYIPGIGSCDVEDVLAGRKTGDVEATSEICELGGTNVLHCIWAKI